jgi:hypothetical protein
MVGVVPSQVSDATTVFTHTSDSSLASLLERPLAMSVSIASVAAAAKSPSFLPPNKTADAFPPAAMLVDPPLWIALLLELGGGAIIAGCRKSNSR